MENAVIKIGLLMAVTMGKLELMSKRIADEPFDTNKPITRYSRETTSATRDSFFSMIDLENTTGATLTSNDSDTLSLLNNDLYGIGYVTYPTRLDSGLKA